MDYVLDSENNSKPNAKDFQILYELYGYIPNGTSTTSNSSLRRHNQRQLEVLEPSSRPNFISFTERNNHQHHPWRLLQRTKTDELHVLDLGTGYHMIAHVMLA
jgi:hypothetical protein